MIIRKQKGFHEQMVDLARNNPARMVVHTYLLWLFLIVFGAGLLTGAIVILPVFAN